MLVADSSTLSGERAMVLDFGIAKLTNDELTKKGAILGTPVYMPLEQFKDSGLVDGRADVFSLGVVTYQLLSGRLPHSGSTQYEVMGQRLMEPIRPLDKLVPSLPRPVVELVMAMLEKEPAARPSMLFVEGAIRRAQGLPPLRQSGFRTAVAPGPKTPETVDAPAGYGDTNQPTPDLPAYRAQDISSGVLQAVDSAAAGTPSEQRAVGELSPPSAVAIPVNVPESLSNMPSVPMPVPPWKSSLDDRASAPPLSLIPWALASPSSPTAADPAQKRRWYRLGAGLAAVAAVTTALIVEIPRRRLPPSQPPIAQAPPPVLATPPALIPTPTQPNQQSHAAGQPLLIAETPDLGTPALPSRIAAKAEPVSPIRKPSSRTCVAQEVTVSCIVTPGLTMPQRQSIVSALHHGNIKLCSTERMILTGVPNRPHVKVTPSSVHHEQTVLLYGLRALTGQYPAEIEIRCAAK